MAKQNKPKVTPFLKYYSGSIYYGLKYIGETSADVILFVADAIHEKASVIYTKLSGRWYCEYCHKYHCRRVIHYNVQHDKFSYIWYVCSCGLHEVLTNAWQPTSNKYWCANQFLVDNICADMYKKIHEGDD